MRPLPSILHGISQLLEIPENEKFFMSKNLNEVSSSEIKPKQSSSNTTISSPRVLNEQYDSKDNLSKRFFLRFQKQALFS